MVKIDQDNLKIRLMTEKDLQAIVEIDERVTGNKRTEYYERKVASLLDNKASIATSLVAEYEGKVIGFIMGNIYTGEFGIPQTTASLDTIGIDPEYAKLGIGTQLMDKFIENLRVAGVENIQTLVDWNDSNLLKFFNKGGFFPSKTMNLEKRI